MKTTRKKYGLYGRRINFKPVCKDAIRRNDIIRNDELGVSLYCMKEEEFVIITNNLMNTSLTEEDLKREWYIRN